MEDDRYEYHGWVVSDGKEGAKRFLNEILNSEEWLGWEYHGMSNCGWGKWSIWIKREKIKE